MAKKSAPKYQKVRQKYRRPDGAFISEDIARRIVASAKGKRITAAAVSKYFDRNPPPKRKERARNQSGQLVGKFEQAEINRAARELNISKEKAAALYFERKIKKDVFDSKPLHEIERLAEGYAERDPGLIIKIKSGGRTRSYKYGTGATKLRELTRAVYAEALAEQNAGKRKKDRTSRLDSDRIPLIRAIVSRTAGNILPDSITFDFDRISTLLDDDNEQEVRAARETLKQTLKPPQTALKAAKGKKGKKS